MMLTLPIKKRWFDMIVSGEKPEEYRDDTPYYRSRFGKYMGCPVKVKFRNGYRADSPSIVCTVVPRHSGGYQKWGAEPGKEYIVLLILSKEAQKDGKN